MSRVHRIASSLLVAALLLSGCPARKTTAVPPGSQEIGPPSVLDPSLLDRG